jgi:membrane-associated protease RseP (regulator of RpoE activity)
VSQSEARDTCQPGDPASPGYQAGVLPVAKIDPIDVLAVVSWSEMTEIVRANPGVTLDLVVEREGVITNLRITPMLTERYAIDERGEVLLDDGEPVFQQVGFVGIGSTLDTVRQPVTAVPEVVWGNIEGVARVIWTLPERMVQVSQAAFGQDERDPNGPISVVGVGRIAGEIASIDSIDPTDRVASFLALLASLNIALFVFNLIPLLPLDGGHVAVALIDGLRRRMATIRGQPEPHPMDPQRLMPLTLVVVAVLISMSVLLMYADIVNPISLIQ